MIEKPPILEKDKFNEVMEILVNPNFNTLFNKIDREYLYWDRLKYHVPADVNPTAILARC